MSNKNVDKKGIEKAESIIKTNKLSNGSKKIGYNGQIDKGSNFKDKTKKLKTNFGLDFESKPTKNIFLAIVMVFAVSLLSVCSVLISGNFSPTNRLMANVANTRIVQAKLAELGYFSGDIDGKYDSRTVLAIKNYQTDNNLQVTGTLDQATTTALGVTDNTQANTDLYLLAKLIYSESRGEVYEGQVAVGAVVLNRVQDAGFPNTIQGVIYQPWAFTALNDGQFSLEPNSTAYQAAQDAMNGWDPTYGCIYYYNPKTATSQWIYSRQVVVTIGNHVFCI